jgi:hypothetical protein
VKDNQLLFDQTVAASWTDDISKSCKVELSLVPSGGQSKTINSGDKLEEAGTLQIKVLDEAGNSSSADISLTVVAVYGLENLQGKTLQVDLEVNLLEGITFAEGLTLQKVEVEQDGQRSEIPEPKDFTPESIGTVSIILTLARADGSIIEVRVDGLSVKGIPYNALEIIDIYGKDYLPQPEVGDLKVYDHIDQIRVGESKRVVDMMWEYGAGTHSKEQYQQLMGRLNTGMLDENPI